MQQEKDWRELTALLKYRFRRPGWLMQALTHPSCLANTNKMRGYEALEFLGDRVVNLIALEKVFPLLPEASERELEDNLSLFINNDRLSVVARRLELGSYLSMSNGAEVANLRESNQVLACAFEAVAGALFLDSAGDYKLVRSMLEPYLFSDFEDVLANRDEFDPKGKLQTLTKQHFGTVPDYAIINQGGATHQPVWTAEVKVSGIRIGEGEGSSRKGAEKQAAANVLRQTVDLTRDVPADLIERRKLVEQERERIRTCSH